MNAIIFAHDNESPDFKPALTLGQGYPKDIEGQPVAHFWKEVLRPRRFVDAAGTAHNVDPARIDLLLSNFGKLKAKGKLPTLPSHHPQGPQDALNNLGHVVDAKKNDAGGLEVLCQFVGIDAIRASARNAASIGTVVGFTDAEGVEYGEILDHVAIVPDPRLTDLQGFKFQPALAASSGPAIPAVVLTPAAAPPQRSKIMDVSKLRKALNLAEDVPAETVIATAGETITADKTALTSAGAALETEKQRADTEKARADAAETKALTLSNVAPRNVDPEILNDRAGTFTEKLDVLVDRNLCTPQQKEAAIKIVCPNGAPSPLMLSQSIATGPAGSILKLLELANTNPFGRKTDTQPVPRNVPGENPPQPVTPERKKELLSHVGA
jgi:hypothetical protein